MDDELIFEVDSPLSVRVFLSRATWEWISRGKHQDVSGMLADVQLTVMSPDEIRESVSKRAAYLYYRIQGTNRFLCVVTHRTNLGRARVTTAYLTDRVKPGELLWQR